MNIIKIIIPVVVIGALGAVLYFFSSPGEVAQVNDLKSKVNRGRFVVEVSATGELQAKRSEKIRGPQGMRAARIYQTSITDMIPEGTLVKAGEYVATLDKTELDTKIKEILTQIEQTETQLEQTKIDTAIEMRGLRDQLINLKFAKEEKLLEVEQNKYEPESVIRKTQIDLEKTERDYQQLLKKYELTKIKSQAQVAEKQATLKKDQLQLKQLTDLGKQFRVTAPKDGMLIYTRNWNGKVGPGSQISSWDPVVAELPDLSDMVSKTYVNEVDISKVKQGQDAKIRVDAFPDREYFGRVIQVANIGEQLRGYDSKVFEVIVQLNEVDSILRPAMTTGIDIVTDIYEDVVYIPIEAMLKDSLNYVFKETAGGKVVKQEILLGRASADEIIVTLGLEENDVIYLNIPENPDDIPFEYLDDDKKQAVLVEMAEDRKKRDAIMREKMKSVEGEKVDASSDGGGGFIIIG